MNDKFYHIKLNMEQITVLSLALACARVVYSEKQHGVPIITDNRDEILAEIQKIVARAIIS